ncbi:MAG: tyrosine--tRNA ligase [Candidatus Aenigmarchaeota archaeon]|nr:tyrosine--tRNA ligase [Candidatus Aenigmarchaeota archaeon]
MEIEERIKLIESVGEEIVTLNELRELLEKKKHPVAYDGFEPSGKPTIAQGVLRAINVNKMINAGCRFIMLAADWHGWANNKLGGDLEKIQITGDYLIEIWKASGMSETVEFKRSTDLVYGKNYWKTVLQIARNTTVNRMIRCSQIMGRNEQDNLSAAQIMYPAMQCADIFELGCDITQLGMDQRKVNILARETGPQLGYWKPVVVSHHMMMGLLKPPSQNLPVEERTLQMKMSKSKPDTAIFMDDSVDEINRKINHAYCPEKQTMENPILEYCRYIIFESIKRMKIERDKKYGGDIYAESYDELEKMYVEGEIHPLDLKKAVSHEIDRLIEPVRNHFEKSSKARELQERVNSFQVTR